MNAHTQRWCRKLIWIKMTDYLIMPQNEAEMHFVWSVHASQNISHPHLIIIIRFVCIYWNSCCVVFLKTCHLLNFFKFFFLPFRLMTCDYVFRVLDYNIQSAYFLIQSTAEPNQNSNYRSFLRVFFCVCMWCHRCYYRKRLGWRSAIHTWTQNTNTREMLNRNVIMKKRIKEKKKFKIMTILQINF